MIDCPGNQWLLLDVTNPSEYAEYWLRYYRAVAELFALQLDAYYETFRKPPNWPSPVQPRCNPEALPPWPVNVCEKAIADALEYLSKTKVGQSAAIPGVISEPATKQGGQGSTNGFERACLDECDRIRRKPAKGRA